MDYVARLLKAYSQFSLDYLLMELPMMQGWALYAAHIETDGWLQFSGVTRASEGYIAMEKKRLLEIAHKG